ncbi:MAG: insulinase family protein [Candidatus Cloacimonetes bacterium]|nr:insulinase family protein [Candidatus Cloacimonadota bacterium]
MVLRKVLLIMVGILTLSSLRLNTSNFNPNDRLPIDENVIVGRLDNGLTYYIRQNSEPNNMAELRLVVRAGSVFEDDDQLGVAHFVEHLAFNGTKNFPGNTLREYMNTHGFGVSGGLNAMTSFDFTVYMLSSRTDDQNQLNNAIFILSEWASQISFDSDEIDKERGIIIEEWRRGRGAQERMMSAQRDALFANSKYKDRMPIGIPEIIETVSTQRLIDFYNDWYRPDMQAVIAVGDFNPEEIRQYIINHFGDIPQSVNPRPFQENPIPNHAETKFTFATDPEATNTIISIMYKHPRHFVNSVDDYRMQLVVSLLNMMMTNRFTDISRRPGSPFLQASNMKYNLVNPLDVFSFSAVVDENSIIQGYEALITEIERAKTHGFHNSELIRAKDQIFTMFERAYLERDNRDSRRLIWNYVNHFYRNTPIMNPEYEFELVNFLLGNINIDDIVNALFINVTDENRIITLTGPENSEINLNEESILSLFDQIPNTVLDVYPDLASNEILMSSIPTRVNIRAPKYDSRMDMYRWNLSNGATVYLKSTNFRNNEILFSAFRKGGLSQADDDIFTSARVADKIQAVSGLGTLDRNFLDRFLADKDLNLIAEIRPKNEVLSGRSSIRDFETLLQMIWLNFNEPRFDEMHYDSWLRRLDVSLRNIQNSPDFHFDEAVYSLLYNDHLRTRQISTQDLNNINHNIAFDFFRSRFDSANGFNFFFVGNISKDDLHDLIERYIAPISGHKVNTNIIDRGISFNQNPDRANIFQGKENKTTARIIFTNNYRYKFRDNLKVTATNFVLNEMLMDNVRERLSGVYAIHSFASVESDPIQQIAFNVVFDSSPDRVDEIIDEIINQINIIINNQFDDSHLITFKETMRQRIDNRQNTNNYWIDIIENMVFHGFRSQDVLNRLTLIDRISRRDIVNTAKRYIDTDKQLIIVLFPDSYWFRHMGLE